MQHLSIARRVVAPVRASRSVAGHPHRDMLRTAASRRSRGARLPEIGRVGQETAWRGRATGRKNGSTLVSLSTELDQAHLCGAVCHGPRSPRAGSPAASEQNARYQTPRAPRPNGCTAPRHSRRRSGQTASSSHADSCPPPLMPAGTPNPSCRHRPRPLPALPLPPSLQRYASPHACDECYYWAACLIVILANGSSALGPLTSMV